MPKIFFAPDRRAIEADPDETLLKAAERHDIPLTRICGGRGRCSTCRVMIREGLDHCSPRTIAETAIAEKMAFPPEIRLSCQTHIRGSGDITLRRLVQDEADIEITSLFVNGPEWNIAGTEKFLFILFADIRGFTSLSEALLPYDVIHLLKRYFHRMNRIIENYGGFIDNYMGDGLMALFESEDPLAGAYGSVRAGIEMLKEVKERMAPYVAENWNREFKIGIGLHCGMVVAGTVGTKKDCKQTIIGDAVNLASRIESANKDLGTSFLISEKVYNLLKDRLQTGITAKIPIRGKAGEHNLYEVVGIS